MQTLSVIYSKCKILGGGPMTLLTLFFFFDKPECQKCQKLESKRQKLADFDICDTFAASDTFNTFGTFSA